MVGDLVLVILVPGRLERVTIVALWTKAADSEACTGNQRFAIEIPSAKSSLALIRDTPHRCHAMAISSNPLSSTRKSGVRKASDRVIRIERSAPARPCVRC